MKRFTAITILSIFVMIGCSKKGDSGAPAVDSTSATAATSTTTPPAATTQTTATKDDDDGMGMASGMAGAATGAAMSVAKSTTEAAATSASVAAPEETKRMAMDYLKTTSIGKLHPNDIVLMGAAKGGCADCWIMTYDIAKQNEVKVQVAGKMVMLYGTMKDLKKSK